MVLHRERVRSDAGTFSSPANREPVACAIVNSHLQSCSSQGRTRNGPILGGPALARLVALTRYHPSSTLSRPSVNTPTLRASTQPSSPLKHHSLIIPSKRFTSYRARRWRKNLEPKVLPPSRCAPGSPGAMSRQSSRVNLPHTRN